MENSVASPNIIPFLAAFRYCFTAPAFTYFCAFVQAFWLAEGRRTVTGVWRHAQTSKHFSNFHRFLKTYAWSPDEVARTLIRLLLAQLGLRPDASGLLWLTAALDDTFVRKWGRKMEGASWQHDAMAPNPKAPIAFGHCWVALGLLWQHNGRWLFLAWAAWLFRPPKITPKEEQQTKLELAGRRLQALHLPAWLRLRVVCDAAYGKKSLVKTLLGLGHHVLSRLPSNAVLYELPEPPKLKRPGRPRKYGHKHALSYFAALTGQEAMQTLCLYGRDWQMQVGSFLLRSRALGGCDILLVVVLPQGRKPTFLFSTELSLCKERVVQLYAARFAIELAFRDLKNHFGLGHYQARRAEAAERHVLLCLVAYTWSQLLLLSGRYASLGAPWRSAPEVVTTGQLRYQVRKERQVQLFMELCVRHHVEAKKRAAIYAELTGNTLIC